MGVGRVAGQILAQLLVFTRGGSYDLQIMESEQLETKTHRRGLPRLCVWLATGFGIGQWAPFGPGSFGALEGVALGVGLWLIPGWHFQAALWAAIFLISIPICTLAAKEIGKKDPGEIVLDEVVSLPVVFVLQPSVGPVALVLGFILHRVFDIAKPPPVRQLEKLPAGLGIMADDVMAAVYANLVLQLLLRVLGPVVPFL